MKSIRFACVVICLLTLPLAGCRRSDDTAAQRDQRPTGQPVASPETETDQDPQTEPAAPSQHDRYQQLVDQFETAQAEYNQAYRDAETAADRRKVREEKYPDSGEFADEFLQIAEEDPASEAAAESLSWIASAVRAGPTRDKAIELLTKHHVESDAMTAVCRSMIRAAPTTEHQRLLREVIAGNPTSEIQGVALYALAKQLKQLAEYRELVETDADFEQRLGRSYGAGFVEQIRQSDADTYRVEAKRFFGRILESDEISAMELYGGRSLATLAEAEVFEMENLSIGKVAPEIVGEDVEGEEFTLSEYHGNVLLLDFWGHW